MVPRLDLVDRLSNCPWEFHYNPLGSVHGGVLSTLLDTAAGWTVHSVLPAPVPHSSAARTQNTSGRCEATSDHESPSSLLANTSPERVPK